MNLPFRKNVRRDVSSAKSGGKAAAAWRLAGWLGLGLLLTAPLRALNPDHKPDSYSIQSWLTSNGLPSNKIRATTQTRDGYLWVATAQGIARFDGNHFTVFTGMTNPELRGGGFFAVQEAADGSLWFGGDNGLFRWRDGHFDRFTTEQGLAHNFVRALALARDGTLVACTREGFSFMRDGQITTPGGIWKQIKGVGRAYLEQPDGTIFVGTGLGLWRIVGERIEQLSGTPDFPGTGFNGIVETPDGSVWIGSTAGVKRWYPDGRKENYGTAQGLSEPRVQSLRTDRDGNVWVAGLGNGLFRLNHDRAQAVTFPGLAGMFALQQISEDREGALWLAASTGLFRASNSMSSTIDQTKGLAQMPVFSVLEGHDGGWWIGLWGGGVYRYDQKKAVKLEVPAALDLQYILSLAEEPDGTLWIGANTGLYRHKNGVTTNLYQNDRANAWKQQLAQQPQSVVPGIAHAHVNSVAPDGEGGIWVGTDGALYHGQEGAFRVFTKADGFPGEFFRSIIRARNGDIWVTAAPGGVARLHEGKWTNYLCGGVLSAITPRGLFEDSIGTIWVTTEGGGLNRFQDGKWRTFTTRDGLAGDFISSIAEDKLGNFWIAFARGVMRVPRSEFAELDAGHRTSLRARVFDKSDGLPSEESTQMGSPNSWLAQDGRVLLATDGGVAVIEPDHLKPNELMTPMHLERFMINGAEVDLSRPVLVPPGSNNVEIGYTAISLMSPEKIRFKIRLAPLDRDWVDVGNQHEVHYAKLPAGDYKFHVIACNSDGLWNETGAELDFKVQPFFYQTGWFTTLMIAAGVAVVFGVYRTRVRLAQQRMAGLEVLVEERTRELRQAKELAEATREETARERARFKFIFEALPVGVAWMVQGKLQTRIVNQSHALMSGVPIARRHQLKLYREATHPEDRDLQEAFNRRLAAGEIDHYAVEKRYVHPEGDRHCWVALTTRHFRDAATGEVQEITTLVDITERKRAEAEREKLHGQLLNVSRQAGMAEVATGVLHNVGNVLNSVNISTALLSDRIRQSKSTRVGKVSELLREHETDLAVFLTEDPRGRQVPAFLQTLAEHLAAERAEMLQEIESLGKNIDHIKEIVSMQQDYAKISGVMETVPLVELVEDALRMNSGALVRHDVALVRDYQVTPTLTVEKHKVLQILVNLVRNAKYACDDSSQTDKQMTVQITRADGRVKIAVIDNGVGIPPENLTRIFSHGFTTRKSGHGFGLHSGALAAKELGGSLVALSDGLGKGATFILELPEQLETKAT